MEEAGLLRSVELHEEVEVASPSRNAPVEAEPNTSRRRTPKRRHRSAISSRCCSSCAITSMLLVVRIPERSPRPC
jgi:hypothetical protein